MKTGRSRSLQAGFVFIELAVVLTIMLVLGSVVSLGVTQFMGEGAAEARIYEQKQLLTAAVSYISDGNVIDAPFQVYPGHLGVLDPYVLGDVKYTWWIDTDGRVMENPPAKK
ncbi:MAG: hypothetical protein PHO26_07980 [Dehalococcoidia bacterium]|nr:hypothetical protein [Dehalococcoidia bacterium]MDD5493966.1 hypothetical protein [Dehalococcoidia bacterium]